MSGVNKVIVLGRLGQDPKLDYTTLGTPYCKMSVAVSKKTKKGEHTEWIKITCWEKTAELANQYLKKGSQVYFEGELKTSTYEKNGEKRYSTEVNAYVMQFIGGKEPGQAQSKGFDHDSPANQKLDESFTVDDVPF